jgi:ferredoxin
MAKHSTLAPKTAEGVKALLLQERDELLSKCTGCGRCFEVCPMVPYQDQLADANAGQTAAGVLDILRNQPGTPEALAWVRACTKSGVCDAHCPEQISPKMMLRLARMIAIGGFGDAPQLPLKDDPDYFNKVHAFGRIQLTDEEREQWTVAPRIPR